MATQKMFDINFNGSPCINIKNVQAQTAEEAASITRSKLEGMGKDDQGNDCKLIDVIESAWEMYESWDEETTQIVVAFLVTLGFKTKDVEVQGDYFLNLENPSVFKSDGHH